MPYIMPNDNKLDMKKNIKKQSFLYFFFRFLWDKYFLVIFFIYKNRFIKVAENRAFYSVSRDEKIQVKKWKRHLKYLVIKIPCTNGMWYSIYIFFFTRKSSKNKVTFLIYLGFLFYYYLFDNKIYTKAKYYIKKRKKIFIFWLIYL